MRSNLIRAGLHALLVMAALLSGRAGTASAQESLDVQDVRVEYNFGRQINFLARLPLPSGITQASVLFRRSDEEITHVGALALEPDGTARFTYDASLNLIPPFSNIVFWFQAAFSDHSSRTSPVFYFRYDDNRFAWQKASDGFLSVHWYDGGDAFGQQALDSARQGASAIGALLGLALDAPVEIYVYASGEDLQGALRPGGKEWIGGHADPALGAAMVSVPPGEAQAIQMQAEIPHELAHVLLYRSIGQGYERLPAWLSEGIASFVEAYPKPDYASALASAARSGALIRFS
ncbi:MAG: peptidase MA family metallohydrolase, partial [Bacteroidota bacterium]